MLHVSHSATADGLAGRRSLNTVGQSLKSLAISTSSASAGQMFQTLQAAPCVRVRGTHEVMDDLNLLVIAWSEDHHCCSGDQTQGGDRVKLPPPTTDDGFDQRLRQDHVRALVGFGMKVGEFPPDHERIRPRRSDVVFEPQGAGTGNGYRARSLFDVWEREDPASKLFSRAGVDRLLV